VSIFGRRKEKETPKRKGVFRPPRRGPPPPPPEIDKEGEKKRGKERQNLRQGFFALAQASEGKEEFFQNFAIERGEKGEGGRDDEKNTTNLTRGEKGGEENGQFGSFQTAATKLKKKGGMAICRTGGSSSPRAGGEKKRGVAGFPFLIFAQTNAEKKKKGKRKKGEGREG